jgi:hypothetical protein
VPIVLLGARQNLSERHACLVGAGEICGKQVARFWRANPVWFWLALKLIWQSFGSWIRTIRPGLAPSEQVVAIALRNTLPDFLAADDNTPILVKFIRSRLDLSRTEGNRLAA